MSSMDAEMVEGRISPINWASKQNEPVVSVNKGSNNYPVFNKEDGELSDGENSDIDYNILPRPGTLTAGKSVAEEPSSVALPKVSQVEPSLVYTDDEVSEDSSDDSDSDVEQPSFKRQIVTPSFSDNNGSQFRNPNMPGYMHMDAVPLVPSTSSLCDQKMMNFQQKRKVNNIWANVLQEEEQQQALDKMESIDVEGRRVLVERGPESYTFKQSERDLLALSRKRKLRTNKPTSKVDDDDSDVSSTALSDEDLTFIRRENDSKKSDEDIRKNCKAGFGQTSSMKVSEVREKLVKMKGRALSYFMANELQEHKTQLICRACEILGKHYCINLFLKTLKIERKGGLLIKSQTRRRTPGGVFFYMMRKDDKYPPDKIQGVFEVDKKIVEKEKRLIRRANRREKKSEIERLQHRVDKMKGTKPMDEEIKDCTEAETNAEDGELPSSDESLAANSDDSESDSSDFDDFDAPNQPGAEDECSNDYLDIHCDDEEFKDL